ncbi:hypothetical protein FGRMN_11134, partial [Fusarium graminum]
MRASPELTKGRPKRKRLKRSQPDVLETELRIVQANCRQSGTRFEQLLQAEKDGINGAPAHILACTDPVLSMAFTNTVKHGYVLDMCPERPLLESDNPNDKEYRREQKKKAQKAEKVARKRGIAPDTTAEQETKTQASTVKFARPFFCVHRSIPRSSWHVEYHQDDNKNLAATLYLMTTSGEVAIHNVHNTNTTNEQINIDQLIGRMAGLKLQVVVGDFNLHHESWAGDRLKQSQVSAMANDLANRMKSAGMKLITEKGCRTYTRSGAEDDSTASCIDLTFVSQDLKLNPLGWSIDERSLWDKSDHRPIRTVLSLSTLLCKRVHYKYNKAALGAYQKMIAAKMAELSHCPLDSKVDLDQAARTLLEEVGDSRDKCIPTRLANAPPRSKYPLDPSIRLTLQNEAITIAEPGQNLDYEAKRVQRRRGWEAHKIKQGQIYRRYAGKKSKLPNGTWDLAKLAKKVSGPRLATDIPALTKDTDGISYNTEKEKQQCFRKHMWPKTSDGKKAPEIPFPKLDPNRYQFEMDRNVDEATVDRIIRQLPNGKAYGYDKIANEAVKLARVELVPFLARFYHACFQLSHVPLAFKQAITVVLPKAEKDSYDSPKSWRPIALLPAFGKILDRIAAERLKEAVIKHDLLPHSQYG